MISVFHDPDKITTKQDKELLRLMRYFGEEFRDARKLKGFSQYKAAKLSGVTQKMISQMENGSAFRIDTYCKVCRAIGLEPRIRFIQYKDPNRRKLTQRERIFGIQPEPVNQHLNNKIKG